MTIYVPKFTSTFRDGGMGLPATPQELPLIIGCSSAGSVATLYYETSSTTALTNLGYGPLTDDGIPILEEAGAALFLKLTGSVAATNSAVTATRIGTSVGTITLSGAATRDFRGRVVITETTAALGSGKFKFWLDGNTYSEEITIPSGGTYTPANSGITITFNLQSGTPDFEAGDVHTFTCTCAHWNATNLAAGITALLASSLLTGRKIRKVYFMGIPVDASAAATNAAAIATHMATLQGLDHFGRALMDCGSIDSTANVLTNYVSAFSDARVAACYGRCERSLTTTATVGFGVSYGSIVGPVALRATQAEISENLGRVRSGPLRGVKSTTLSQDEGKSAAFAADNKIITLRSHRNKPGGAYVTQGFLKSPVGSDFKYWDYGVTLDTAAQAIKTAADEWLNEKLRALKDGTGNLHPVDSERVKMSVEGPLNSVINKPTVGGLDSHVSGQEVVVETNYDFLTTAELRISYRMIPTVPVEGGAITLGLTRSIVEEAA
jgi:hypothetical protein